MPRSPANGRILPLLAYAHRRSHPAPPVSLSQVFLLRARRQRLPGRSECWRITMHPFGSLTVEQTNVRAAPSSLACGGESTIVDFVDKWFAGAAVSAHSSFRAIRRVRRTGQPEPVIGATTRCSHRIRPRPALRLLLSHNNLPAWTCLPSPREAKASIAPRAVDDWTRMPPMAHQSLPLEDSRQT